MNPAIDHHPPCFREVNGFYLWAEMPGALVLPMVQDCA